MIQLSQSDFDHLVAILEDLPDWHTEQGRLDLLSGIFAASPRKRDVLRVPLDGSTRQAAVRVVQHLAHFGQDAPGRETLLVLVAGLRPLLGEGGDGEFLRRLPERYAAPDPPAPDPPAPDPPAPDAQPVAAAPDPVAVLDVLVHRFTLDEMHDLCFRLRIDEEEIGGSTRSAFARGLVRYLERYRRLPELVSLIRRLRGETAI